MQGTDVFWDFFADNHPPQTSNFIGIMSLKEMGTDAPIHPPPGTLIDGGALQLAEVLGIGGYGVVYRAVETYVVMPRSYAVKCLVHASGQSSARRQLHIREISLHQIASAHPGIVTLHKIIEEQGYTFIIMDFAADHDLFTQILHECRYLGDDALIKHVFLQLLDAVEYCHSLGIYHRDLKPENILCFDGGCRVALTDFGLATTEKISEEFRTGSIYHMSPECQGEDFETKGGYSPMFNDVWSLGIILLNLATGRNPWKSATKDDPTFQAYLQDPAYFFPAVLPISFELNEILVQTLDVDWQSRITLPELRRAIERVDNIYSDNVLFEGNVARCPEEAGKDLGTGLPYGKKPVKAATGPLGVLGTHWSSNSRGYLHDDPIVTTRSAVDEPIKRAPWPGYPYECGAGDSDESAQQQSPDTSESSCFSDPSLPATPINIISQQRNRHREKFHLDTDFTQHRHYKGSPSLDTTSTDLSGVNASVEDTRYSSSFFLASPASPSFGVSGFERMDVTSVESPTMKSAFSNDSSSEGSIFTCEMTFTHSRRNSPDSAAWPEYSLPKPSYARAASHKNKLPTKSMMSNILYFGRFFPRSPNSSFSSTKTSLSNRVTPLIGHTQAARLDTQWGETNLATRPIPIAKTAVPDRGLGGPYNFRSPRGWFPGKFFTSSGARLSS